MKPEENKKPAINGGVFTTNEGLKISIPPKNVIERDVLRRELLKMQEGFLMELEASSNYVYRDEKGKVMKRMTIDGKILTEDQSEKEGSER